MTRTRIKFCGITRQRDAAAAIDLGVDALGFVFYEKSKRFVTIEQLAWLKNLPAFVQLTGLFVNPDADFVRAVTEHLPIDLLQFHGDETPAFCQQFSHRYVKAVPMQHLNQHSAEDYMSRYAQASGFLLDNYGLSEMGGSGTTFDWANIPRETPAPLILAGGLHAGNVGTVIRAIAPYGVDVSSGIEASAGIKSTTKMQAFVNAVNWVESKNK